VLNVPEGFGSKASPDTLMDGNAPREYNHQNLCYESGDARAYEEQNMHMKSGHKQIRGYQTTFLPSNSLATPASTPFPNHNIAHPANMTRYIGSQEYEQNPESNLQHPLHILHPPMVMSQGEYAGSMGQDFRSDFVAVEHSSELSEEEYVQDTVGHETETFGYEQINCTWDDQ